jgi:hypothetical protein
LSRRCSGGSTASRASSGTQAGRDDEGTDLVGGVANQLHARDADTIVGDNADIFRLVGINGGDSGGFLTFNYDQNTTSLPFEDRGTLRLIPRAVRQLDYTPGGPDFTPAVEAGQADIAINPVTLVRDIGDADEVHGESGDDSIYGMVRGDVLFGDGHDDVIIGGYGPDWISGGTGDDGILGDDGRLFVGRNSTSFDEPLYGVAAIPAAQANLVTQSGNGILFDVINVTPTTLYSGLKYTADLTPQNLQPSQPTPPDPLFRPLYANDIIYGGWGNDSMHAGAGDDAISGAEAPVLSFTNSYDNAGAKIASHLQSDFHHPFNPGNPLGYQTGGVNVTKFDLYDANDPLREILLNPDGTLDKTLPGDEWILNFVKTEGPLDAKWFLGQSVYPAVATDGDDHIFADLGNDWVVGGTGRDVMFSGWGDDLINLDDDIETVGTTKKGAFNPGTDTNPSYEDLTFGGAGRDVFLINTNGDRAFDWRGEFNSFFTPFAQFGADSVNRVLLPALPDYLYALSKSGGADQTLAAQYGSAAIRNGEPFGELGLVTSQDAAWGDQQGQSRDPQPGNTGGAPVDLHNGSATAGVHPIYETASDPETLGATRYLSEAELTPVVAAAKQLWTEALGADDGRLGILDQVQIVVGNLPQDRLGVTIGGLIIIDSTAAGRGWFVDPSLSDSREFTVQRRAELMATSSSPAYGRMDLLTTVTHELGNALGFKEVSTPGDVMAETLGLGVRGLEFDSLSMRGTDGARGPATGLANGVAPGLDSHGIPVDIGPRQSGIRSMVDWSAGLDELLSGTSPYGEGREKTGLKPLFPAFEYAGTEGWDARRRAAQRRDGHEGSESESEDRTLLAPRGWEWQIEVAAASSSEGAEVSS